jgi:HK97 family phage prohead protease
MGDIIQRAVSFEVRGASDGNTLAGYAAVFDTPTEIHERGQTFMEQLSRGAFAKAINNQDRVVLQFDHGQHPLIGSMPLGAITSMEEDARGLYVEAQLTDNWLVQPVRDAIAAGAVDGMSFRFAVEGETWDRSGDIPLRTISEVRLYELGPVVFPAYAETSVAVRSALEAFGSDTVREALADHTEATPDEGQPETTETPDEGHRLPNRNQRQALILPHLTKENPNG